MSIVEPVGGVSLLDDPALLRVDRVHDTAHKEKYKEKKGAVPEVLVFMVQPQALGDKDDKALLVFDGQNGGEDAVDGPDVLAHTDDEGTTEKVKIWEWIGADRRTLRFNAWRQGQGRNKEVMYIKFKERPTLSPGDCFVGGVAVNSGRKLPPAGTMAKQVNLDITWAFGKGKPGRPLSHGCYWNGDAVPPRTWEYATAPEEERFARAMPYEQQLLPRVVDSEDLYISTAFTPSYAQAKAEPPREKDDVYQPVEAGRSLVRLPMNRYPRTDPNIASFGLQFLLPDESEMQQAAGVTGALVGLSRSKESSDSKFLSAKGMDAQSRWTVEEELTLDVVQMVSSRERQRFSIMNASIYSDRFLQAMGIPSAPHLAAIMNNPIKPIAYDIIFQPSVVGALNKAENQDAAAEDREATYPDGAFTGKEQRIHRIVPRVAQTAYYNWVRVSEQLARRRYLQPMQYQPARDGGRGIVESTEALERALLMGFGMPKERSGDLLPPKFKPGTTHTWTTNPGWFFLDFLSVMDFDEHGHKYDYYAVPLVAGSGLLDKFPEEKLTPSLGERSATRIREHTTAEGDAFVIDLIARQTPNRADADVRPRSAPSLTQGRASVRERCTRRSIGCSRR